MQCCGIGSIDRPRRTGFDDPLKATEEELTADFSNPLRTRAKASVGSFGSGYGGGAAEALSPKQEFGGAVEYLETVGTGAPVLSDPQVRAKRGGDPAYLDDLELNTANSPEQYVTAANFNSGPIEDETSTKAEFNDFADYLSTTSP